VLINWPVHEQESGQSPIPPLKSLNSMKFQLVVIGHRQRPNHRSRAIAIATDYNLRTIYEPPNY
jgi:hypothetical protein